MVENCIHIDFCRLPVSHCNKMCEKARCKERPLGFYLTKKNDHGPWSRSWSVAELTKYGWKAKWSDLYQNDSDFKEIDESSGTLEIQQCFVCKGSGTEQVWGAAENRWLPKTEDNHDKCSKCLGLGAVDEMGRPINSASNADGVYTF